MKTWREIEEQLKTEHCPDEMPPDLHHSIMRAVRVDRAADRSGETTRNFPFVWLLAGASAAAVIVIASAMAIHRAPPQPTMRTADVATPALFFANIEAIATAPVQNEVKNLREDFASAARFIENCLPSDQTGT